MSIFHSDKVISELKILYLLSLKALAKRDLKMAAIAFKCSENFACQVSKSSDLVLKRFAKISQAKTKISFKEKSMTEVLNKSGIEKTVSLIKVIIQE
ncbi:hypothetical protein [Piscirickettsia litoralis]|uniref:Uncharacterized protein n=1 Tax=Piscirickettsia litoralis TaxID=1891921 RepID=A0ABX2ZXX5_9GAMM|nr:hypothetical protein [Piscirickettsia litoralis]ODN41338.1 hypothetical protein BGC07_16335 [Piscirickettsia litoralis]